MADLSEGSTDDLVARTLAAIRTAAARVGLPAGDAELLRLGSNAVFELGEVVARVTLPGASTAPAEHSVDAARWLNASGVPAVEALAVEQPQLVDGMAVTFWTSLGTQPRYGSTAELGGLLVRLHALEAPQRPCLPVMEPFERLDNRLTTLQLDSADVEFLRARASRLRTEYSGLKFQGEPVVLHGDANVGNVLRDRAGSARLTDLDGMCRGPREWDLVLTAIFYDRYGWHDDAEYRAFVEVYGMDLMTWDGYQVLADVRELLMVSWSAAKAREGREYAVEASKRIAAMRDGRSRRDWTPL